MEIGEPGFPDAATGDRRGAARDRRRRHLLHVGARPAGAAATRSRAHYADHYGVDVAPERVIVTAGSSAALLLVMALIVNRDERILLADPGYPCNRHFVRMLEGEPVGIPVGADIELSADGGPRSSGTGRRRRAAC